MGLRLHAIINLENEAKPGAASALTPGSTTRPHACKDPRMVME